MSRTAAAEPRTRRTSLAGVALVVTATALFGTIGTARVLGPDASSWSVGALRLLVAVVVLVAFAAWRDGSGATWALVRRRESLLAGAGQAAFQVTFLAAVELAGVAVATLVAIGSAPLVTGVLTRAITPRWLAATGVALLGLVLLVAGSVAPLSTPGLLLALGAGLSYSCYTTASSRLAVHAPAASVAAAGFVVAAALLAPALLVTDNGWVASGAGLLLLAHLSVAATALAYLLFVLGLQRIPAASAQTLGLTEPVVATALGVLVLDERLRGVGLLGAVLVVAGLAVLGRRPRSRLPSSP